MVFAIDSMSPQVQADAPGRARRSRARIEDNRVGLRSQRNPLKRLNPAKAIQGNPSLFLGQLWFGLCPALLDLAYFLPALA
jgi:hypothetical protein